MLKLKSVYELQNSGNADFGNGPVDISNYAEIFAYYEVMKTIAPQFASKCCYYQELLHVMTHADGVMSYVSDVMRPGMKLARLVLADIRRTAKAA